MQNLGDEGGREKKGEWEGEGREKREKNRQKRSTHPFEEASISISYLVPNQTHIQNPQILPQTKMW